MTHRVFCTPPLSVGDVTVDIPLRGLPQGAERGGGALPRAAPLHQLLHQGIRLHAPALHTVQGGLRAFQNADTARQTKVF